MELTINLAVTIGLFVATIGNGIIMFLGKRTLTSFDSKFKDMKEAITNAEGERKQTLREVNEIKYNYLDRFNRVHEKLARLDAKADIILGIKSKQDGNSE